MSNFSADSDNNETEKIPKRRHANLISLTALLLAFSGILLLVSSYRSNVDSSAFETRKTNGLRQGVVEIETQQKASRRLLEFTHNPTPAAKTHNPTEEYTYHPTEEKTLNPTPQNLHPTSSPVSRKLHKDSEEDEEDSKDKDEEDSKDKDEEDSKDKDEDEKGEDSEENVEEVLDPMSPTDCDCSSVSTDGPPPDLEQTTGDFALDGDGCNCVDPTVDTDLPPPDVSGPVDPLDTDVDVVSSPIVESLPDETSNPTVDKSSNPTVDLTSAPTVDQTSTPTLLKTSAPTVDQTSSPTIDKTSAPTVDETSTPTVLETATPTSDATASPSISVEGDTTVDVTTPVDPTVDGPAVDITSILSHAPSYAPRTYNPTEERTYQPTLTDLEKTYSPTLILTYEPTEENLNPSQPPLLPLLTHAPTEENLNPSQPPLEDLHTHNPTLPNLLPS